MKSFKETGLSPAILANLEDLGYETPSPIQGEAIPFILNSKQDLIALAQTGTGKTAAFGLPVLDRIDRSRKEVQAIIVCPTRELCLQIFKSLSGFGKGLEGLKMAAVYGGERADYQIRSLKAGAQIVVGTPGRVHDFIRRKSLKLGAIDWLILDEADEMMDMGFKEDLDAILAQVPETRRTLLFSATMSKNVGTIAKKYLKEAKEISVGEKNSGADNVTHEYFVVSDRDRFEALRRVLDSIQGVYGILFCRTRMETQEIADRLKSSGYLAEAIHGDIAQNQRTKIMAAFSKKRIKLLVATDVAARGIDVSGLTHIINYNFPDQNEAYTHRSGRTGRANSKGVSVSIISPRELRRIREVEKGLGKKFEYKKVPSNMDAFYRRVDSFMEEIEASDASAVKSNQRFEKILEKASKLSKEEFLKKLIAHEFIQSIENLEEGRDLNANLDRIPKGDSGRGRGRSRGGSPRFRSNGPRRSFGGNRSGGRPARPAAKRYSRS